MFIVHCKKDKFDIYIGRPRYGQHWGFGNPFVVGRDGVRGECITQFENWLKNNESLGNKDATPERRNWILNNLQLIKGKTLGCWCAPRDCHGRILRELSNQSL